MPKQLDFSGMSEAEKNERAAAAVTSYGVGTKSYNSSSEKKEMDRQRQEVTERYARGELKVQDCSRSFLLCRCRSFPHTHPAAGHSPSFHDTLRADYDWRSPEERKSTYFGWES